MRFRIANRTRFSRCFARHSHHSDVVLLPEVLRASGDLLRGLRTDGRGAFETEEFAALVTGLEDSIRNERKLYTFSEPRRCFGVWGIRHNPQWSPVSPGISRPST